MANDQDICRPNIVFHYICCIYGIRQDTPPPIPSLFLFKERGPGHQNKSRLYQIISQPFAIYLTV